MVGIFSKQSIDLIMWLHKIHLFLFVNQVRDLCELTATHGPRDQAELLE